MTTHNHWVEETLAGRDIALLGFADLSEIDADARRKFRYGVSIAMALAVLPSTSEEPSAAYFEEYRRVSAQLKEASAFLTEQIQARGYNALSLWLLDRQDAEFRTPLPFKTLATRAGLGWIGKSAALVTKEYGNAVRLGGVLTDMPLRTGTPINASLCGDCMECVKHCPGRAIRGNLWDLRTDRDSLLDAHACKRAVVERGKALGRTEGACGICIAVCPWTKSYFARRFFS
ncbi:MAG: 4Fe-4S binding protein [Oscillospiraceae bacterium]|jgi:epoxyqueuosine reductase QueG|nr:4Fe-4S binding protein [Oscillospiraceae bacterium]